MRKYSGRLTLYSKRLEWPDAGPEPSVLLDEPVSIQAKTLKKARYRIADDLLEAVWHDHEYRHITYGHIFAGLKLKWDRSTQQEDQ